MLKTRGVRIASDGFLMRRLIQESDGFWYGEVAPAQPNSGRAWLYADLQNAGVRCWFAPHDLPISAKTWDAIDAAIRIRDKLLLILSKERDRQRLGGGRSQQGVRRGAASGSTRLISLLFHRYDFRFSMF